LTYFRIILPEKFTVQKSLWVWKKVKKKRYEEQPITSIRNEPNVAVAFFFLICRTMVYSRCVATYNNGERITDS
jgi:hypothetical protein